MERLLHSKLLVKGANRRIASVDDHIGMATAGLLADGKHLASRGREEAYNFRDQYSAAVPVQVSQISRAPRGEDADRWFTRFSLILNLSLCSCYDHLPLLRDAVQPHRSLPTVSPPMSKHIPATARSGHSVYPPFSAVSTNSRNRSCTASSQVEFTTDTGRALLAKARPWPRPS